MSKQVERGFQKIDQAWVDNAPKGVHSIGDGLLLKVKEKGGRLYAEYLLRVQHQGKRRDIYLSSATRMKLREAKRLAFKVREAVQKGEDWEGLLGRKAAPKLDFTLSAVCERYFAVVEPSLKRGGDASRWWSQLRTHILPALGGVDVQQLTTQQIVDVLTPLFSEREGEDRWGNPRTMPPAPETSKRALMRLKGAMAHAKAEGAEIDMQIVENVPALLPRLALGQARIASVPWQRFSHVYAEICGLEQTPARLALRLAALTVQRVGPVRAARLQDVDLQQQLWTIPHGDLKKPFTDERGAPMDFRCPLSAEACAVVELAQRTAKGGYLFPGGHSAKMVSDVAISRTLKLLGEEGTPHGLRSTFRGWAVANGGVFEIVETALQHRVGGAVTQAYMREDYLEQRREIMQRWAAFVVSERDAERKGKLRVVE